WWTHEPKAIRDSGFGWSAAGLVVVQVAQRARARSRCRIARGPEWGTDRQRGVIVGPPGLAAAADVSAVGAGSAGHSLGPASVAASARGRSIGKAVTVTRRRSS